MKGKPSCFKPTSSYYHYTEKNFQNDKKNIMRKKKNSSLLKEEIHLWLTDMSSVTNLYNQLSIISSTIGESVWVVPDWISKKWACHKSWIGIFIHVV